ncbi:fimbrial protein [Erwinia sp. S59]|uniref:fimbrial protein n=1 Tax=Erwinia sp. S59 TaxID=2769340 RepID=UPI0019099A29|nr:fimbrial protein [Erwinia sp. S59]MBK0089571.1 fimbrial protein [Erwinia sp. S59]
MRYVKCLKGQQAMLLACLYMALPSAQATDVTFKGTLVESIPCEINSGGTITIDFDTLIIRGIDGDKYRRPVPYSVACTGTGSVRLSVQGTPTSFDNTAVVTNKSGLGIRVEQNGSPLRINQYIAINLLRPPTLTVVPVANPASLPDAGDFTSRATIIADYQ